MARINIVLLIITINIVDNIRSHILIAILINTAITVGIIILSPIYILLVNL